ncbi:hypothetical protein HQ590_12915 [bacterium]|nr:hypothetical protein [bacterium]
MDPSTIAALRLTNSEPSDDARIAMVSLPVPMNAQLPAGLAGLATQSVDVAWWPESRSGSKRVPRRRLLFACSQRPLPARFRLGKASASPAFNDPVEASLRLIPTDDQDLLIHQVGELRFQMGERGLGLRLGARWREELHWWEWLRLERLWSGPVMTAYRVGGCIEAVPLKARDFLGEEGDGNSRPAIKSPWLHRQNWLLGEVFVLCFANGLIQLTCRHVNNHRFDEGRELNEIVPVIGFSPDHASWVDQKIDGRQARVSMGDITLDLSDALPLVSSEHPGAMKREGNLIVYQPYEGVEIAGDGYHRGRDDGFVVRASERRIPKGIARTVRFAASLSEVAPTICRLTVPEWWYALSRDLWPDAVLPVHDSWDARIDSTYAGCAKDHRGRFDGHFNAYHFTGESPYAQSLYFYRTGNLEHRRRAVRDAYYIADVAFDHSTETMRMSDYPLDGSTAPPLFRTVGLLFGHLETGDPYLLDCAESASSHWYWMDRHMWPRYAYGRDGASIRSLVFLWDYTGKEDYRAMAREAIGRMIQCQQPDGSYRDQGSGTGMHGMSHLPVKPWMANLANDPIIDYLERSPDDDPALWRSFLRYADFLLRAATQPDGTVRWPYQIKYGDDDFDPWIERGNPGHGKLPFLAPTGYQHGHKARALNVATRHTGLSRYFDTWLKFYNQYWAGQPARQDDHWLFEKSLQHLPYAQAHSWNARWRHGAVEIAPILSAQRPELEGTISTPLGPVTLRVRRVPSKKGRPKWELMKKQGPRQIRVVAAPAPTTHQKGRTR